ncbi:unnamed protein product [Vitrella brassicaformis CCMP3155]|uniref:Uncharacterized protein n=1 Tax=Vitrella brassicaformis (strain CCMP3155) TaxID=1169540 RepID=A0A0G4G1T4_VITBC|nr:unnamed protein product [Vitrella brassicaformis CCMP3155]|eukprot:CEM22017.1 unnamed protein product [Vitrella brassicaformis CCMP3155]
MDPAAGALNSTAPARGASETADQQQGRRRRRIQQQGVGDALDGFLNLVTRELEGRAGHSGAQRVVDDWHRPSWCATGCCLASRPWSACSASTQLCVRAVICLVSLWLRCTKMPSTTSQVMRPRTTDGPNLDAMSDEQKEVLTELSEIYEVQAEAPSSIDKRQLRRRTLKRPDERERHHELQRERRAS